jgi:hypothetical protein
MLSEYEIDLIEKHLEQFDLVINHQYLPNGFSGLVGELDKLMIARGKKAIQKGCASCIAQLFKDIYKMYEDYKMSQTNVKIVEVVKPIAKKLKQKNAKA